MALLIWSLNLRGNEHYRELTNLPSSDTNLLYCWRIALVLQKRPDKIWLVLIGWAERVGLWIVAAPGAFLIERREPMQQLRLCSPLPLCKKYVFLNFGIYKTYYFTNYFNILLQDWIRSLIHLFICWRPIYC